MTSSADEPPLSHDELKELRELLSLYRDEVSKTVEDQIPAMQARLARRLRRVISEGTDNPDGPTR